MSSTSSQSEQSVSEIKGARSSNWTVKESIQSIKSAKSKSQKLPEILVSEREMPDLNQKSSKVLKFSSHKFSTNLPKLSAQEFQSQRKGDGEPFGASLHHKQSNFSRMFSKLSTHWQDIPNEDMLLENEEIYMQKCDFGLSRCQLPFKVSSSDLSINDIPLEEEDLEECNPLKRWKYWMQDKKRLQTRLSKSLNRNPCNLQVQESDKYRQTVEERTLMMYSQLQKKDKWKEYPSQWQARVKLGHKRRFILQNEKDQRPQYSKVKLKIEEGEKPEIEYIGIPKTVKEEKGYVCDSQKYPTTIYDNRREQLRHSVKQRKKMQPHSVEMRDLEVIGRSMAQKKDESVKFNLHPSVPTILVAEPDTSEKNCSEDRKSVFCLLINNECEIKYEMDTGECQVTTENLTCSVDFGVNSIGCLTEKVLKIENRGTMAISYDWLPQKNVHEKIESLYSLHVAHHDHKFFFNKNSGIFLPGQIYNIKFYHHSQSLGVQKEYWMLKTKPSLPNNVNACRILLSAVVTEDNRSDENHIDMYLRRRVRDSVVSSTIEILLKNVFSFYYKIPSIEYQSIFNKKELFEYHNVKYYYHSKTVNELEEIYEKVNSCYTLEWDFSLNTLVEQIKKHKASKEKNELLKKVAELARKLLRPNYLLLKEVKKYKMTNNILCRMANLIEEDYENFKNIFYKERENVFDKNCVDIKGFDEYSSSSISKKEQIGESVLFESDLHIEPVDSLFLQFVFYIKVYYRLCEAIENIVGVLETNKIFEPWPTNNICFKDKTLNNNNTDDEN